MSFTQFKLEDSPTAEECRAVLGDLSTAKEKRKGSFWYMGLWLIGLWGGWLCLLLSLDPYMNKTLYFTIPLFTLVFIFFITLITTNYEGKLINYYNLGNQFTIFLKPHLVKEEHILAVSEGNSFIHYHLDWLPKEIHRFSYFIFTTDRLIVFTLKPNFKGSPDMIKTGIFQDYIQAVHVCSLGDQHSVKYGGITPNIIFVFNWTPIKFTPINQEGMHTCYLADKYTASGKMIKTIFKRLSNKRKL